MTKLPPLPLDEGGGANRRRIHLREISGEADTPLETVGQDLRAGRLRRGDDLATVSKVLKIRKDHLEALEEDRLDSLPGRTYAIGFVRSYADYLGLDGADAVERFKTEIAGRNEASQPTVLPGDQEGLNLTYGWIATAALVLCLVVYGGYRLLRSADTMEAAPVAPVPAAIAPAPKKVSSAQPRAPEPVSATAPAPNTPPVPEQGGNVVLAAGTPAPTTTDATRDAAAAVEALPRGRVYGTQNHDARVIIHVLEPTRVLVEGADGTLFINRTLQAGDSYRVPDYSGLTLTTSNGGAVSIELDGQEMGAAGRPKQMTEALSLDPQAIADRYSGGRLH